jgi:putative transposase
MKPLYKLDPARLRELETVLDAGPAVTGWQQDQRWTLTRITQAPSRQAGERDETAIAAWRKDQRPQAKRRRRPGSLAVLRG